MLRYLFVVGVISIDNEQFTIKVNNGELTYQQTNNFLDLCEMHSVNAMF